MSLLLGGLAPFRWPGPSGVTVIALLLALTATASEARAQVVRGTVRAQQSDAAVGGAQVLAKDSSGSPLAEVQTDREGHYSLALGLGAPFRLMVRKLGWKPSETELLHKAVSDTVVLDLFVPAEPVEIAGVEVRTKGVKTANDIWYDDAKRHGWKVYSPEIVAEHRDESVFFPDLLRAVQVTSVQIPIRPSDCVRSARTGRCLTYVVDGQVVGQSYPLNPKDIYFFAILSGTESSIEWGDRAPWGAIVIYTRMYGDKLHP